MSYKDLK